MYLRINWYTLTPSVFKHVIFPTYIFIQICTKLQIYLFNNHTRYHTSIFHIIGIKLSTFTLIMYYFIGTYIISS